MPKILITGNGFDLSLGLPTSYNDFIKILKKIEKNHSDFYDIYNNCENFNFLKENCKAFEIEIKDLENLKKEIDSNIWFQFFKNEFEIETWIDFENKIEHVLNIIFKSIDFMKNNIFNRHPLQDIKTTYDVRLFGNNIEIVQTLNTFKIITYTHSKVFLNKEFLIQKYDHFIDVDINHISKFLYNELNKFKEIFNKYFDLFIFPFYDNLEVKVNKNLFSKINLHYTFNYTPTFEKFYNTKISTRFLHGKINAKKNEIVLGINEIPDEIADKKLYLPFTKYFQKLNNNTDYEFLNENKNKRNLNYYFFFFGHSLDKSDEDYINEVFDFVNNLTSKLNKIIVIYKNEESISKLLINLLSIRGKKDILELMKNKKLIFLKNNSQELINELNKDISNQASIQIR